MTRYAVYRDLDVARQNKLYEADSMTIATMWALIAEVELGCPMTVVLVRRETETHA